MLALLRNIFSLSSNPLLAAYPNTIRHRFHNHIIVAVILMVYEVIMLFFSTPQVKGLENGEIWFQVLSHLPMRSLLVTIGIIVWYGIDINKDYRGVRDTNEQKAFEMAELRNLSAMAQGLGPIMIPPKPMYRINWLHLLRMVCEAFIYAAILFALLPYLTQGILSVLAPSTPPPIAPSKQLFQYETSLIQAFAIACGSGFYEEYLFRYQLIRLLNGRFTKYISPVSSPFLLTALDKTKWVHGPRYFASIMASAIIYSLSHILIPTGDAFHLYTFFYRLLFALGLTWVMTQRKFGIAVMTHTFYGIFYFLAI